MYKTVEATYRNGYFFPAEPLHVESNYRFLLTVIPGEKQTANSAEECLACRKAFFNFQL